MYERIEPEAPRNKRYKLANPHFFSGAYGGAYKAKLLDEVYAYLDNQYDL